MQAGPELLQTTAERIIARWLIGQGVSGVRRTGGQAGSNIDIMCDGTSGPVGIKVKADAYCGSDAEKIADRSLLFYRPSTNSLALEAVSSSGGRQPGWGLACDADEIYYYYLALGQTVEDLAQLLTLPDQELFSALQVESDELLVLPASALSEWFAKALDRYVPRPVITSTGAGWYRLVPRFDVERSVSGMRVIGPIFDEAVR